MIVPVTGWSAPPRSRTASRERASQARPNPRKRHRGEMAGRAAGSPRDAELAERFRGVQVRTERGGEQSGLSRERLAPSPPRPAGGCPNARGWAVHAGALGVLALVAVAAAVAGLARRL